MLEFPAKIPDPDQLTSYYRPLPPRRVDMLERWSMVSVDQVPRWALLATLGFVTVSIIVSVVAALTRGPWMDEFWTLWLTSPDIGWGDALRNRWLADVHPPLFTAASRLAAGLLGQSVELRRLQNIVPLIGLLGFFVYADRCWLGARRFVVVYATLCFGSYFSTGYFPEYRSYFPQFCLGAVFFACGYALLCRDHVVGPRQRPVAIGLLAVCSLLLVNLHFVTALAAGISLGVMGLVVLAQRDMRLFFALVAIALLSCLPLVAVLVFQAPTLLAKSGGKFWIDTSLMQALHVIAGSVAKGIGVNLIACLAAGWGVVRARRIRTAVFGPQLPRGSDPALDRQYEEMIVGLAFLATSLAVLAALVLINFQTPIIVDRYLVLCSAAIVCAIAVLAKDVAFLKPIVFTLVLLNATAFLAFAADKVVAEPRWNASAELIAGLLPARCATTPVQAFIYPYANTLTNEDKVVTSAYHRLADEFGFPVRVLTPGDGAPLPAATNCPRILWTENVPWPSLPANDPEAAVLEVARNATGLADIPRAGLKRTRTGAVIILPPAPGARP